MIICKNYILMWVDVPVWQIAWPPRVPQQLCIFCRLWRLTDDYCICVLRKIMLCKEISNGDHHCLSVLVTLFRFKVRICRWMALWRILIHCDTMLQYMFWPNVTRSVHHSYSSFVALSLHVFISLCSAYHKPALHVARCIWCSGGRLAHHVSLPGTIFLWHWL